MRSSPCRGGMVKRRLSASEFELWKVRVNSATSLVSLDSPTATTMTTDNKDSHHLHPGFPSLGVVGKGSTIGHMGLAGMDLGASPIRTAKERDAILARLSSRFIHMRCTDASVITFCFVCGFMAIFMQTLSLGTERWLFTIEPRPINLTDRQAWPQFQQICLPNTLFRENVELGKLSGVTAAIMSRIQLSSIVHVVSLVGTMAGTVLSVMGYARRDERTLYSGIVYISSGLTIAVAVMQFICVVDDEMAPRMKPNAQGEPSKYAFNYGYSFLGGALSFLVVQICAVCQLVLFFRRYPGMEGKLEIVPGLKEKIHRAKMDRELGMLPPPTPKKGALPASPGGRRSSRHSAADEEFTFDADTHKWEMAEPHFRGYEPSTLQPSIL